MRGVRIVIEVYPISWAFYCQKIGGVVLLDLGPFRFTVRKIA